MKTNIYFKLISLVFCILIFSCNEDRIDEDELGIITGKVVAYGNNTPLQNVRISTQPITSTVFTDSSGKFRIPNVPVGDYSVEARIEEYITDFEPATAIADVAVNIIFELELSSSDNSAPEKPELITPTENEVLESIEAEFTWTTTDPDDDELIYSLELRNDQNNDVLLFEMPYFMRQNSN